MAGDKNVHVILIGWRQSFCGEGTRSPYVAIGHLNHAEMADWMPRLAMILERGRSWPFDPFDREAQFREGKSKTALHAAG